jgi:hypothetical protein
MTTKADTDRDNLRQVSDSLRSLGANLIGVVRGAGNPLELSRGLDAFIAALGAFEGATGRHPRARELAEMLRVDLEPKSSTPTRRIGRALCTARRRTSVASACRGAIAAP